MLQTPLLLLFPAAMAFAASTDLLTMTIPNRVSLALLAGFLVIAPFSGLAWSAIGLHLLAGALMLIIGFALFATRIMGGGDAKLLAAAALWTGFDHLVEYCFLVAVLGGLLSVLILMFRAMPLPPTLMGQQWLEHLHKKTTGIPYGIALAGAGLIVYPATAIFAGLSAA
jgi:prepilin peptidase CpaA